MSRFRSVKMATTPRIAGSIALSPNSVSAGVLKYPWVLKSPSGEEAISKRCKELGFDVKSINDRDEDSLIDYIAKLEAEIYDPQYYMGILEKNEWQAKYEEAKYMADSAEQNFQCERASLISDLTDAEKREDSLKKALGIEKERVKNIEKTLHEMRAEYAEVKSAADSKFVEARKMVDDALKKMTEAEEKMRRAESLETKAARYHRIAERKLHEVEEREDDLRRGITSSKYFETKEKEIQLWEWDVKQRENFILEKERDLDFDSRHLKEKEKKVEERLSLVEKKEEELELKKSSLNQKKEEIRLMKLDLEKSSDLLEEKRKQINNWKENVDAERREADELFARELRLKEDTISAQKQQLEVEADRQKAERAKFEDEWKLIGEEKGNCIEMRREIENYLAEKVKEFEDEKKKELQNNSFLKERVGKELKHDNSEMERLDAERRATNLDRERRDQEWAKLDTTIEELKVQREKLEEPRELLRADREEIPAQFGTLMKLEDLNEGLDSVAVLEMQQSSLRSKNQRPPFRRFANQQKKRVLVQNGNTTNGSGRKESDKSSSPISAPFSRIKRYADTLLEPRQNSKKRRKENDAMDHESVDASPWYPKYLQLCFT